MENKERMVTIENMVNAKVTVKDPTYGINRRWDKKGQKINIAYSVVEGMLWQDGFRHLLENGILYINSMKDKQDLGLEPVEAEQPINIIVLTEMQMKNLLTSTPFIVFKKEISMLNKTQIDNLVDYAIKNQIVDVQKCSLLKKITGRDIISVIKLAEDSAMVDERARKRENEREEGRRV